jgi:hypothetical protein
VHGIHNEIFGFAKRGAITLSEVSAGMQGKRCGKLSELCLRALADESRLRGRTSNHLQGR